MKPTCSVLIPVYNGKKTILRAIESAEQQGDAVTEIIVVDNQSDDGTWELLQSLTHPKIRLHRNPSNLGLFGNFNSCLAKAQGEIIVFLCADDRFYPQTIQACLKPFSESPALAVVNAQGWAVDEEGQKLKNLGAFLREGRYSGKEAKERMLLFHSSTGHNPFNYPGGVFMRRRLIEGLTFDTGQRRCGDIDFFYRALERGDLEMVATPVCEITFHAQQEGRGRREEPIEMVEFEAIINKLDLGSDLRHRLSLNFRALSLWRGSLFLARGAKLGFRNHWRHAFAQQEYFLVFSSFLAFVGRRLLSTVVSPGFFMPDKG